MLFHLFGDMRREAGPALPAQLGSHTAAEIVGQHFHIAFTHTQGRQGNDLEAQPVEQVGTEIPALRLGRQVFIGGGHDTDIDARRATRSDPRDLAIFDRAQQPFLRPHRQSAQFVEK